MPSETNRKGDIAEQRSAAAFMEKGYNVYFPLGDGYHTDYIVTDAENTFRCQCKSARTVADGNAIKVRLINVSSYDGSKYEYPSVDLFVGYHHETGGTYIVPSDYDGKEITLRFSGREDIPTMKWAEDFNITEFPDADEEKLKEFSPKARRGDGGPNTVLCDNCGEEFERRPTHVKENNYCSRDCYNDARTKINWPSPEWLKRMQEEYSYRHLARRLDVHASSVRKKIENINLVECDNCGDKFHRPPNRVRDNNYCSVDCYQEDWGVMEDLPPSEWIDRVSDEYSIRHIARRLNCSPHVVRKKASGPM